MSSENKHVVVYAKDFPFSEISSEWKSDLKGKLPTFLEPHGTTRKKRKKKSSHKTSRYVSKKKKTYSTLKEKKDSIRLILFVVLMT